MRIATGASALAMTWLFGSAANVCKGERYTKATGIVRRVDDLGRIVIPKEIRRTLKIREGDPLEIYTEKDGGVIFRKYSQMGDVSDFAAQLSERIILYVNAVNVNSPFVCIVQTRYKRNKRGFTATC